MKIIITADVHFGYGRASRSLWAVEAIYKYAANHDIKHVFVLGDLFHNRKDINIKILNDVSDFLAKAKKDGQEWLCFPGNHDMFLKNSWDVNSLRPLSHSMVVMEECGLITLGGQRFWIVPFVNYESVYMEIIADIDKKVQPGDILLTHIGVRGAKLNECFLIKNWNIVDFSEFHFERIFAGHFHCYQQIGNLIYPGSPVPFRFDEGLVDHGFIVYDVGEKTEEFVNIFTLGCEDPPPDYITINDGSLDHPESFIRGNHIRIHLSREYTPNELSEIKAGIVSLGAASVHWMKPKTKKVDSASIPSGKFGSFKDMFRGYVQHDRPKHYDEELLYALNDKIAIEAEEKISLVEAEDENV